MFALSRHFDYWVKELARPRYRTYQVGEILSIAPGMLDDERVHVVVRLDVDSGLERCVCVAQNLASHGIRASFYFLTQPERYYDVWTSAVPATVASLGFEVGLHTDHYWEQLTSGSDAVASIKEDVHKLSRLISTPIRGMVAHGHPGIDRTDKANWHVYADIPPADLGLTYHDVTLQEHPVLNRGIIVRDYLGVVNGWRYWPVYPRQALRRVPVGSVVVFIVHPANFFDDLREPRTLSRHAFDFCRVRLRHQIVGAIVGEGVSARVELRRLITFGLAPR